MSASPLVTEAGRELWESGWGGVEVRRSRGAGIGPGRENWQETHLVHLSKSGQKTPQDFQLQST